MAIKTLVECDYCPMTLTVSNRDYELFDYNWRRIQVMERDGSRLWSEICPGCFKEKKL